MKYQETDGRLREYPHSFTEDDKKEYLGFLGQADEVITLHEICEGNRNPKSIAVRHDVDHSLAHALKFARWEAAHGFRSSYYLLHTAYYYRDTNVMFRGIEELQHLGHEVGLHTNAYELKGNKKEALEFIFNELVMLSVMGFTLRGIAAHGGSGEITDDQMFDEVTVPQEVGADYEAYNLVRNSNNIDYISDNRGRWRSPLEYNGKQIVVSAHPCHWPFNED